MTNANEPAYPVKRDKEDSRVPDDFMFAGLTKREAFALAAMQGLSSGLHAEAINYNPDLALQIAEAARILADNTLAELAKDPA